MALPTDTPVESPTDAPVEMMPTDAPTIVEEACTATGWSDTHAVTFDGTKYDCQAEGEVVLAKSLDSDFEIQGRFTTVGFPTVAFRLTINVLAEQTCDT
jgi:hypothetical protein